MFVVELSSAKIPSFTLMVQYTAKQKPLDTARFLRFRLPKNHYVANFERVFTLCQAEAPAK